MLFAASIWSMGLLSKGFLPDQDESKSRLAIELPPGEASPQTDKWYRIPCT
jgi:multidrug efflux pump subunit AcrB